MLRHYDLIVIGSGPAGQKAAINAAKIGKRVAVIERLKVVGGVCINTGTIPSKAVREAVLHLTGYRQRFFYGASYSVKRNITMTDLVERSNQIIKREIEIIRVQMERNGVELISGHATFTDSHTISITDNDTTQELTCDVVVLAVGTRPARPDDIPFSPGRVIDSDELLHMDQLPKDLLIVGGGVIGVEYACMLQAVGVRVTLVERCPRLLEFLDGEIGEALHYHMREEGIRLKFGESVSGIDLSNDHVEAHLDSGKILRAKSLLYSIGRQGSTDSLNLKQAGLSADSRGRLTVNEHYQTEVPHIYAVGDVIGFPSLASTSMEQGRLATCHAFGLEFHSHPQLFPYGIYTIPEISMVGRNEVELTNENIPFEVGIARYREIARGQLIGDTTGLLKLIFHQETRRLLGVHIIGEGATELIHIGQAVMAFEGTIDYFVNNVFNYPTLAECYKVAALDGVNRVGGIPLSQKATIQIPNASKQSRDASPPRPTPTVSRSV